MQVSSLAQSPIGNLIPISGTDPKSGTEWSHYAFAPSPLPDQPALTLATLNLAAKAAMEVARLDQAVSQLPNPQILLRPILRREATSTSALEGTYAAFDEVLESDFLEERQLSSELREIRNYIRATEFAIKKLNTHPISRNFLGEVQRIIVHGTPGDTYDSGDIRKRQVYIGPKNRPIHEARFVPLPNGPLLEQGVSDWEKWVNAENDVPIVAKVALAHYQFETLHPYADGNGRLGRLVAVLQLIQEGILKHPALNIAPWLEANRQEYIDGLLAVTLTGDYNPWVLFFSQAVMSQAKSGIETIQELLRFRERVIGGLRSAGLRGSALEIAENLIGYPVLDVPTAAAMTGKTFEAANKAVGRLVEEGILRELTGRSQNRLFGCDGVLRIITL